ncbi:hypothetical protein Tco_1279836, partial [Tanacetum coccineum]
DSPLLGGHTPGSDEGSKKLNELTELCTKLFDKVTSLEDDLKQTKKIYSKALTKLVKKVKHLEAKLKSTIERRKARMVISDDEEDLVSEDTSKQGRMTETEYEEFEIDLNQTDENLQRRSIADEIDLAKILAYASRERVKTYTRRRSTDSSRDSTAGGLLVLLRKVKLDEMEETDNIDWNTVAEQNMAGYKMGYFKGMSYDKIIPIFKVEYNKIQTLYKKDTQVEKTKTKRIAKETLLQESFKKLRTAEASSLVKERFRSAEPTEYKERALWVELKRLFEPDKDDVLWKLQRYMYDLLTWRLYGTCGVHHVSSTRGHDIYMLIEKDYPLSTAVMNLMLSRRLQVEEDSEMARHLIMKIFIEANKPRS